MPRTMPDFMQSCKIPVPNLSRTRLKRTYFGCLGGKRPCTYVGVCPRPLTFDTTLKSVCFRCFAFFCSKLRVETDETSRRRTERTSRGGLGVYAAISTKKRFVWGSERVVFLIIKKILSLGNVYLVPFGDVIRLKTAVINLCFGIAPSL